MAEDVIEEEKSPEVDVAAGDQTEVEQVGDGSTTVIVNVGEAEEAAPVPTEEEIKEEVLEEQEEQRMEGQQWQEIANLNERVSGMEQTLQTILERLPPKEEQPEEETQQEVIPEEAPNLLEPVESGEHEQRSKPKRKHWVF